MEVPATPAVLSLLEQRVLGVLIEKQKTTPDVYPMSLNGLTVGCNQKSNREPVLNLQDDQVEATLENLNCRQLVIRVSSGRVDKWKHVLYELWNLDKVEIAVLAELFLRGPQTEGELRGRVSRMESIEDIDTLRNILQRLQTRGMVDYLTPEGRRGTVVGHGFMTPEELSALKNKFSEGIRLEESQPVPRSSRTPSENDELRKEVTELRQTVNELVAQVRQLWEQLGISPAN